MHLHTDQITIQPPIRSVVIGANIAFFLDDVTADNGGTLVMPGTHKGNYALDDPWDATDTVAASRPAGTCMIFESRLWHATGANKIPGSEPPILLLYFTRPWMRQQENPSLSLMDEVYEKCNDRVKAFLDFKMSGSVGSVQGSEGKNGSITRLPRGENSFLLPGHEFFSKVVIGPCETAARKRSKDFYRLRHGLVYNLGHCFRDMSSYALRTFWDQRESF